MNLSSIFRFPRWRGLIYAMLNPYHSSYGLTIYKPLIFSNKRISWHGRVNIFYNARIEGIDQYEGENFFPMIIINDGVTIQQNIHLTCADRIEIGKNTALASNVTITDIEHPYTDINIPIERQKLIVKPVKIGSDCKIYNNAVILQGTVIGNHCVIGANSVVNGTFPDYSILVGAPARIVKRYNTVSERWEKTNPDGSFIQK